MERKYENRPKKRLSRTEQAVIFSLIILASANAELDITDSASLDAFKHNLETEPLSFVFPIVLLASSGALGLICFQMHSPRFRLFLGYAAIIPFAIGIVSLTNLITP